MDEIAVFTEGSAFKVKRLGRDPKVRVARCDVHGKILGSGHEGTGRVVVSAQEEKSADDALHKKYGWIMWLTDVMSTLSGRIKRRKVILLKLD